MERKPTDLTIEWLTGTGVDVLNIGEGWPDQEKSAIPFPEELGSCSFEGYHLGQGLFLTRTLGSFKPEFAGRILPVALLKGYLTGPLFSIHEARVGKIISKDLTLGTELMFGSERSLFMHVDSFNSELDVEVTTGVEMTTITMEISILEGLLGVNAADSLLNALTIKARPAAVTRVLPPELNQILNETLPHSLNSRMRILFSQAKTLEYLCALAKHLNDRPDPKDTDSQVKAIMTELHMELLGHEGKVPLLSELAERYAMSARTLNDEFRKCFGQTIYAFVANHRLAEAHIALERTELPMKTISANLGYNHVNHFITAFRKRYGYPPGSLRRGKGPDESH
ncbi:MAG: helix-turn-helix domain-containing protein [Rectinemataceae bacterium]